MSSDSSDTGSDVVLIDGDDISNYNPAHILPESSEIIAIVRQWLQPTSYENPFGEYRKHLASHATGTGRWLTSSTTYRQWLHSPQLGTLWVKGIPGSGKSVIAAQMVHNLAIQHPGTPVLYFFFRQIIDANHEPIALLRDWLDQALIYSPPLQQRLKEYVEASRALGSLSMDDLWRDLRLALGGLPNNAYCVVDALDEMDQGHNDFLQRLAELGRWKPEKIKVLMTSRPIARLEAVLRKTETLQIRLDETAVDKDISTFVQQKLSATSITDSDQKLILAAVPGRANGLFLYAKLAMDAFLRPGADIPDVLKKLPQDLNYMYTDLLKVHSLRSGIPPDLQRLILQCATHATRPLRLLEVAELLELTCMSRTERDLKATKDMVRAACGPLLEILPDETVCVVHHSFTEYLTGVTRLDNHANYPALESGPTHNTLALVCLTYLESGCLSHIQLKNKGTEELGISSRRYINSPAEVELRLKYPFFEYAVSNWYVHITKSTLAGYNQGEVNKALQQFFDSEERLNALLSLSWPWHRDNLDDMDNLDGPNQLHVSAGLGLEHYVQQLLKKGNIDVDSPDGMGRTSLWWAASSGHAGVVRLLAQAGANPDQDESHHGYKPLHKAASANHAEVVKVLMEFGVSPMTEKTRKNPNRGCGNAPRTTVDTPLMYACQYGHLEAVDVLLSYISDPDIVSQALRWAAQHGRFAIVRRVLQHPGADVNAKVQGASLLALACRSKSEDTVLALLEAGADPNIPTRSTETQRRFDEDYSPLRGLCQAKMVNNLDYNNITRAIFSLLVGAGANVHERGADGSNALHWAVKSPILTRLLLDAGVDANVASWDGATPLHKARDIEVICLLISLGEADINKRDKKGKTPLLSRLADFYAEPTHLIRFLEFGPDCSVVDNKGNNVIYYLLSSASSRDRTTVLRQLLAMGGDPNRRNSSGDLPLHSLQYNIRAADQILDLLLAAGADLNGQSREGATLLFQSIRIQPIKIQPYPATLTFLKFLIDKGASLTVRDFRGRTLLHEAVKRLQTWESHNGVDRESCLGILLARGMDHRAVDNYGNNLLHELATHSLNDGSHRPEAILGLWNRLLSLGLDPRQRNCAGRTPLHILCSSKSQHYVSRLSMVLPIDIVISKMKTLEPMTIDVADNSGITPLHLASTTSGVYAQKLLDAGADPTRATIEGRTPLHLAAQSRESNIVGILLDALHRHQMIVDLPAGDVAEKTTAVPPRGSWYREKTFQLSAKVIDAKETFTSNGWAPLNYACRSGRPETVALLLQANANVNFSSLVEACFGFEQEQSLWDRAHQSGEDLDTGGLLIGDRSRPSIPKWNLPILDQTARIDEILEILLERKMQFDPSSEAYPWHHNLLIKEAFDDRRDYTVGCLTTAISLHDEYKRAIGQQSTRPENYAIHQRRHVQGAARRSLTHFEGFKKGEPNEELFQSLMNRREYDMVRELSRAGADFFKQSLRSNNINNFDVLVSLGFASLAKGIVDDLNADLKGSDDEEIRQVPVCSSQSNALIESHNNSNRLKDVPYLLTAVRRALPNMEMVRFLVEDCGVDVDKLHSEKHGNSTDSQLLSVAKGEQWWHAALAVPYFIERSAELNVRDHDGQTPLHIALRPKHETFQKLFGKDIVQALVKGGADVNAVDAQGRSCLAYAGRDVTLVRFLLENGAKADAHALSSAIDESNLEVLEVLLSAGVDPNIPLPDRSLSSPGHKRQFHAVDLAARTGKIGARYYLGIKDQAALKIVRGRIVETLLAHGADPFATFSQPDRFHQSLEDDGDHPLISVSYFPTSPHCKPHVSERYVKSSILHDLIQESAPVEPFLKLADLDVDRRDPQGETLLLSACSSRCGPDTLIEIPRPGVEKSSILRYLLSKGADPLAIDNQGRNALHQIFQRVAYSDCQPDFHDTLSYMVSTYPTLINQKDKFGRAPLHLALQLVALTQENTDVVTMLLQAGADPLLTDGEGNTSLHIVSSCLPTDEIRELFTDLLHRGCAINGRNVRGETPLFCSMFLHCKIPDDEDSDDEDSDDEDSDDEYSDDEGSDDEGSDDEHPDEPRYAHEKNVFWKASGADFGTRDNAGRGLLHVAARGEAVRFQELVQMGLDPMMEDENKQTPLDVAAAYGNNDVLALFATNEQSKPSVKTNSVLEWLKPR
ncbi:ankyrin repeat-containing domain protein [Xylaria arbuscula]|nr:ankyrin repeat-containing domain protein [Xylaria arbuscula]